MLDLNEFYWAGEAAEVLTRNSGHRITVDYVRRLIAYGLLRPVRVNGRNLYRKTIEEGRASDVHPDIMRAAGLGWDTLAGLLTTQAQWLWPALTGQRPDMLIDKCERLRKVRRAICEVKR